jgi:hypothetical protein
MEQTNNAPPPLDLQRQIDHLLTLMGTDAYQAELDRFIENFSNYAIPNVFKTNDEIMEILKLINISAAAGNP